MKTKFPWLPTIAVALAINLGVSWIVAPTIQYFQAKQLPAETESQIDLPWAFSPDNEVAALHCQLFDRCVYIDVTDTANCEKSIEISMVLTDANHEFVADASSVIISPQQHTMMRFELGANRKDFENFYIEHVRCSASPPSEVSKI